MDGFLTWNTMATYAGATVIVTIATQFLKGPIDKLIYIPTKYLAYVIALIVLVTANLAIGERSWDKIALCFVNALIIATSGMGTYDLTLRYIKKDKSVEDSVGEDGK